ncbi:hypothetical protein GCM10023350_51470 [Nocardioides endophyticus]|uniref:Uncharacterized protein n=1 Tax=Nocardioides endophyticus TaxID=1353775 RepID=A0ABP8ZKE8_9ACTN
MADDDLTPPPDESLPDQSRARIRADLLAAAQDGRGGARRWLAPIVAAAAVLVVVGVAGWAVQAGRDDNGAPAGAPTPTVPGADWTMGWPDDPAPSEPSGKASVNLSTCVDPMGQVLAGAQQVVTFPADDVGGETTMWVAGESYALCDVRAGITIVHKPISMAHPSGVGPFQVSSIYPRTEDGFRTVQVAGGLVPQGATAYDVSYTFPDGHTERATTTTDDQGRTWWRMVYSYAGGEPDPTPIRVTVSLSGVQKEYSLKPGVDTCAQANETC